MELIEKNKNIIVLSLCSLIILIYYSKLYYLSVNIPKNEDFINLLSFLNDFEGSFLERLMNIIKPSQEHRNATVRIITLSIIFINGSLNFNYIIVIAQLFLLGWVILISSTLLSKINILLAIPLFLLVYQFSSFESITWGLVSIQHFGTLFFVTLSLYVLYINRKYSFFLSFIIAIIATYTFGKGFLVFFSGIIILFFDNRKKKLVIWIFLTISVLYFYFSNHNTPKSQHAIYYNPIDLVLYFFSLLGNFVGRSNRILAIVIGFSLICLLGYSFYKKLLFRNTFLLSLVLFVLLTLIAISLNRFFISPYHAFANHYKFYPVVLIALLLISVFPTKMNFNKFFIIGLCFTLCFNIWMNIKYYPKALKEKLKLESSIVNWRENEKGLINMQPESGSIILKEAIRKGNYIIPDKYSKLGSHKL